MLDKEIRKTLILHDTTFKFFCSMFLKKIHNILQENLTLNFHFTLNNKFIYRISRVKSIFFFIKLHYRQHIIL